MVYTGIMATEVELDSKAGENVSTGSIIASEIGEVSYVGTGGGDVYTLKKTLIINDKLVKYGISEIKRSGSSLDQGIRYKFIYTDETSEEVDHLMSIGDTSYTNKVFLNPELNKTVNIIEIYLISTFSTAVSFEQNTRISGFGGWTETNKNLWVAMAESVVNNITRFNWSDKYAGLNTDVKFIISDTVSSYVAIYAITFDLSTFSDRVEGETMINVHREIIARGLSLLRRQEVKTFMEDA